MATNAIVNQTMNEDSAKEEENAIHANLDYMNKMLTNMCSREGDLSESMLEEVKKFKMNWKKYFSPPEVKDEKGSEHTSMADATQFSKDMSTQTEQKQKQIKVSELIMQDKESGSCSSRGQKSTSSSARSTSSERDTSSDSESSSLSDQQVKVRKKKITTRSKSNELLEVLSRVDSRKVPSQEKYNEESGQSLTKYLERFEEYCKCNFKGDRSMWIGELERHLSGKSYEAFMVLREADDSYKLIKKKLLKWYESSKEIRKKQCKNKFRNLKYREGESLFLFASKLESLFKQAYPHHKIKTSKTLQEQYLAVIPKSYKKEIYAMKMSYNMKDKRITWNEIKKCASYKDLQKESEQRKEERSAEESTEEILINVRQDRQSKLPPNVKKDNWNSRVFYSGGYKGNTGNEHERRNRKKEDSQLQERGRRHNDVRYSRNQAPFVNRITMPPANATMTEKCSYCNRIGHDVVNCRSRLKVCYLCGRAGHFYRECHANKSRVQSAQPPSNRNKTWDREVPGNKYRNDRFNNQSDSRRRNSASDGRLN